ncbi:peptide deformylase [Planctomycetota bacterium]|nr:peptide deformylase [Planctomycetota bacterium]MDB4724735.1 peptide deformylase [Planctomycetota bacterium]MDB4736520.1 peptide deformylase [Planctomycetota bacterium]
MSEPRSFEVVLFPDPVLRKEAAEVVSFDDDLRSIVDGMFARMFESQGVGLAAPQVGLSSRIFVLNDEGDVEKPDRNLALINPTIKSLKGDKVRFEEGCLSLPGVHCDVTRPDRCLVHAYDVEGKAFEMEAEGFVSRIIQHEYDHLQGVLLVDRMTPSDKMRNRSAVEDLKAQYRADRS